MNLSECANRVVIESNVRANISVTNSLRNNGRVHVHVVNQSFIAVLIGWRKYQHCHGTCTEKYL